VSGRHWVGLVSVEGRGDGWGWGRGAVKGLRRGFVPPKKKLLSMERKVATPCGHKPATAAAPNFVRRKPGKADPLLRKRDDIQ
jgi:hypothetical protein